MHDIMRHRCIITPPGVILPSNPCGKFFREVIILAHVQKRITMIPKIVKPFLMHPQTISLVLYALLMSFANCVYAARPAANADASLPNILILYADDLGFGDLGCYHSKSKIPTPHLNRLAAEGIRFTDGHSSSGICTPSKYFANDQ